MSLKQLKQKIAEKKSITTRNKRTPAEQGIGVLQQTTKPKLSPQAKRRIAQAETTSEVQQVLDEELPKGYTAIGKNDRGKLMTLKENIIKHGIASFDYETNGDPEDPTQDPQDHELVGVSFAYQIGQAFYMPLSHVTYGANWDLEWFITNFLKPILEHPKVRIIAHNIQFEHQMSFLHDIDMFPKTASRLIEDTMIMVKMLALHETINGLGEVVVGLKPSTKALLADENGMVHGLLHVDNIKSFKDTVTRQVVIGHYKSGKNKGEPKYGKEIITFDKLPVNQETVDYGCSDSDWALGLYFKLRPLMEDEGLLDSYYELNVPFSLVLGEYELAGWRVEPSKLEDMKKVADTALNGYIDEQGNEVEGLNDKLHQELVELTKGEADINEEGDVIVPSGVYPMGNWRGEPVHLRIKTPAPFNWSSSNHKTWLFFHVLKIDLRGLERSKKTGMPSVGADNMSKMIEDYEGDNSFMKVLKEKSKYDKILSTYVNGMLPFVREDTQKVHTNLRLVQTWRLSSSKPNLQNIPRADNDPMGIRGVFVAPIYDLSKDYSKQNMLTRPPEIMYREKLSGKTMYIACDYSQIELKVLAWYANEQSMISTLANGGDLHSVVAKEVFKLDCTVAEVKKRYKPFRYRAKKVNFGIVYGMTEFGLSKDRAMGMTKDEAKVFIQNYYKTYPGIRTYAHDMIAFAREYGYVETIFGNRRPIPEINNPNSFIRSKGENKAMNTPIQGSAGDIIRRAMVSIRQRAVTEAPYVRQVMQIHDELIIEVPVEYVSEGARWVKSVMEAPLEGFTDIMPIIAEPAVGVVWQDALDVDWRENGQAYVTPKAEKKEATDVTWDEIQYALPYYEMAGIEVVNPFNAVS